MIRADRGYVGVRMLLLLGVVASLVWVIPLVFLNGRDRDPTAGALVPEAGWASAGPTGEAPLADVPAPTGGDVVSDPIGAAMDLQAQSLLNDAIRVAQTYYAENGTFDGFGPDVAAGYDPSIVYTEGAPASNMVAMTVTPTTVVLLTVVDGADVLCAAAAGNVVTFGRTGATTPQECQGGWEEPVSP